MTHTVLSSEEIASLRAEVELWHDATCDIFRPTSTDDEYGGYGVTTDGPPIALDVHCTVESGVDHDQVRVFIGTAAEVQWFLISLPADQDIDVGDKLVIDMDENILTVKVHAVLAPESLEFERRVVGTETGHVHTL